MEDAGIYKIDCECGSCYIGQTKRSIATRLKEHIADVKHRRSLKSAVCEHMLDQPNHYLRFDQAQVLATENWFIPRMLREAIEIQKHPKNFNREDGLKVPPVWDPVLNLVKSQARPTTTASPFAKIFFYFFMYILFFAYYAYCVKLLLCKIMHLCKINK